MHIGMNLLLWTDEMTPAGLEICGRLRDLGFDAVELPGYDHDYDNYVKWGAELDRLGLLRTAAAGRGPEDNPASLDPAIRRRGVENNKRSVECHAAAGCSAMIGPFHSALGVFSGSPVTSDEWKAAVDSMREVAEHAETYNIDLCLEAVNRFECYLFNCAADGRRFVEDVGHPRCKMMYDTFHANIEEKSMAQAIRTLAGCLGHVHISENDRSTPGQGAVRWDETFATLREIGYDGFYVIEAFGGVAKKVLPATKIWRKMYADEFQLARDGLNFIHSNLDPKERN